jgi:uncharacterized protein with HEPN domain
MTNKINSDFVHSIQIKDFCHIIENRPVRFGMTLNEFRYDIYNVMSMNLAISQNGEHFRKLSDDFKSQFDNFSWPDVRRDRNRIVRHYQEVTVEDA